MQIRLSDHFSFGRLLRFTLPSIAMMILTSLYSVADGLFVSNMVGDIGLSAVNIMFPVAMLIAAVGFMLGTGGSAVVARTPRRGPSRHGEPLFLDVRLCRHPFRRRSERGRCGVRRTHRPARRCERYSDGLLRVLRPYPVRRSLPFMLQTSLSRFRCRGKAEHGSYPVHRLGRDNFAGDWVLIQLIGLPGAAWATVAGYCVGGIIPLVFFITHRSRPAPHRHKAVYP